MAAKVFKISPEIDSTPDMIIGMLKGHSDRIKHIIAVVTWDDDSHQLVHDKLELRDIAFAGVIVQKYILNDIDDLD